MQNNTPQSGSAQSLADLVARQNKLSAVIQKLISIINCTHTDSVRIYLNYIDGIDRTCSLGFEFNTDAAGINITAEIRAAAEIICKKLITERFCIEKDLKEKMGLDPKMRFSTYYSPLKNKWFVWDGLNHCIQPNLIADSEAAASFLAVIENEKIR